MGLDPLLLLGLASLFDLGVGEDEDPQTHERQRRHEPRNGGRRQQDVAALEVGHGQECEDREGHETADTQPAAEGGHVRHQLLVALDDELGVDPDQAEGCGQSVSLALSRHEACLSRPVDG